MYDIMHVCMTGIVKCSLELTGTCDRQGCRQPVLTPVLWREECPGFLS